jgi:hypothetical protein
MVRLDGNVLGLLDIIHRFEDCQSVPNTPDSHRFEIFMLQGDQCLADNFIFLSKASQQRRPTKAGPAGTYL